MFGQRSAWMESEEQLQASTPHYISPILLFSEAHTVQQYERCLCKAAGLLPLKHLYHYCELFRAWTWARLHIWPLHILLNAAAHCRRSISSPFLSWQWGENWSIIFLTIQLTVHSLTSHVQWTTLDTTCQSCRGDWCFGLINANIYVESLWWWLHMIEHHFCSNHVMHAVHLRGFWVFFSWMSKD